MSEQATDIMEANAELTEKQMDDLRNDEVLADECRDIFIAAGILAQEPKDTEQQLERFHKRHFIKRMRRLAYRTTISIAASAACIAALLLYVSHNDDSKSPLLVEADADIQPRLTDSKGSAVPLKMYVNNQSPADPIIIAGEYKNTQRPATVFSTVTDTVSLIIPKGHSCRVDLADGTKVFLHPGSRLNYPSAFGGSSRKVALEGEAYFIVAKDAKRPFIVSTSRSQTIVTGTEFNVKSYNETKESVTLINGKVKFISNQSQQNAVELMPGQEASISNSGMATVCEADTMQYTAWRDGYHYFDEATVADILRQIGTSYNVSIECHNRSILSYHMHYVVRRDIPLDEAVRLLNKMGKLHARLTDDGKLIVK